MGKIKSITEAFSQHPSYFYVMTEEQMERCYDKPLACKEIKEEHIRVDSDKICNFYVGYNFEGQKIFQCLASSVNVNYMP